MISDSLDLKQLSVTERDLIVELEKAIERTDQREIQRIVEILETAGFRFTFEGGSLKVWPPKRKTDTK